MNDDKIKGLYDIVSPVVEGIPSVDAFRDAMRNRDTGSQIYEMIKRENLIEGLPDNFDDFSRDLFGPSQASSGVIPKDPLLAMVRQRQEQMPKVQPLPTDVTGRRTQTPKQLADRDPIAKSVARSYGMDVEQGIAQSRQQRAEKQRFEAVAAGQRIGLPDEFLADVETYLSDYNNYQSVQALGMLRPDGTRYWDEKAKAEIVGNALAFKGENVNRQIRNIMESLSPAEQDSFFKYREAISQAGVQGVEVNQDEIIQAMPFSMRDKVPQLMELYGQLEESTRGINTYLDKFPNAAKDIAKARETFVSNNALDGTFMENRGKQVWRNILTAKDAVADLVGGAYGLTKMAAGAVMGQAEGERFVASLGLEDNMRWLSNWYDNNMRSYIDTSLYDQYGNFKPENINTAITNAGVNLAAMAVAAGAVARPLKALGAGQSVASGVGSLVTGYTFTVNDFYEDARKRKGLNEQDAANYANAAATIQSLVEMFAPPVFGSGRKALDPVTFDRALDAIKRGDLDSKSVFNYMVRDIPQNIIEEMSALASEKAVNIVANNAFGTDFEETISSEDVISTILTTGATVGLLGALTGSSERAKDMAQQMEYANHILNNREEFVNYVQSAVERGDITRADAKLIGDYVDQLTNPTNQARATLAGESPEAQAAQQILQGGEDTSLSSLGKTLGDMFGEDNEEDQIRELARRQLAGEDVSNEKIVQEKRGDFDRILEEERVTQQVSIGDKAPTQYLNEMTSSGRLTQDEQNSINEYVSQQQQRGAEIDPQDPWFEEFASQVEERLLKEAKPVTPPPRKRVEIDADREAARTYYGATIDGVDNMPDAEFDPASGSWSTEDGRQALRISNPDGSDSSVVLSEDEYNQLVESDDKKAFIRDLVERRRDEAIASYDAEEAALGEEAQQQRTREDIVADRDAVMNQYNEAEVEALADNWTLNGTDRTLTIGKPSTGVTTIQLTDDEYSRFDRAEDKKPVLKEIIESRRREAIADLDTELNDFDAAASQPAARPAVQPEEAQPTAEEPAGPAVTPAQPATPPTQPEAAVTPSPSGRSTKKQEIANPRNKEELADVIERFFNLTKDQAKAVAEVADRIIATMALRRKITLEEAYLSIAWYDSLTEQQAGIPIPKAAKGATLYLTQARTIVAALNDPDVSTPLHELAHVFENWLTPAERKVVMDYAGTKTWNRDTSEAFAEGFEAYLKRGRVSVPVKLRKLFDKFANWIMTYASIVRDLSPQMEDIYGRMLSEGEDFARINRAATMLPKNHYLGGDLGPVDRPATIGDFVQYEGRRWFVVAPGVLVSANMQERKAGVNLDDVQVLDVQYKPARNGDTVFYDGFQAKVSFANGKIELATKDQKIRVEDNELNRRMLDAALEMNNLRNRFDKARAQLESIVGVSVPGAYPRGVFFQLDAWHGSPHVFDDFKLQHIGSGEGAQAYGWGLYFTDDKRIAEWYRQTLSTDKIQVNGEDLDVSKWIPKGAEDWVGTSLEMLIDKHIGDGTGMDGVVEEASNQLKERQEFVLKKERILEAVLDYKEKVLQVDMKYRKKTREYEDKEKIAIDKAREEAMSEIPRPPSNPSETVANAYLRDVKRLQDDKMKSFYDEFGTRESLMDEWQTEKDKVAKDPHYEQMALLDNPRLQDNNIANVSEDSVRINIRMITGMQAQYAHLLNAATNLRDQEVTVRKRKGALYKVSLFKDREGKDYKWFNWFSPVSINLVKEIVYRLDPNIEGFGGNTPESFYRELYSMHRKFENEYRPKFEERFAQLDKKLDEIRFNYLENLAYAIRQKDGKALRIVEEIRRREEDLSKSTSPEEKRKISDSIYGLNNKLQDVINDKIIELQTSKGMPTEVKSDDDVLQAVVNEALSDYARALTQWGDDYRKLEQEYEDGLGDVYPVNQQFYDLMTTWIGPKATSEMLLELGYDGVRYPTKATQRRTSSDYHNYVIFDENAVKIEERILFQQDQQAGRTLFQISGTNADMDLDMRSWYAKAVDMENSGSSAEDIKLLTNWERGSDGKWRYEIADPEMDMDAFSAMPAEGKTGQYTTLGAIIKDDKGLFAKYPQLKKYRVHKFNSSDPNFGGDAGYFFGLGKTIGINDDAMNPETVLAHELTHAIQQIEGFTPGGNQLKAMSVMPEREKKKLVDGHIEGRTRSVDRLSKEVEKVSNLPLPSRPALVQLRDGIMEFIAPARQLANMVKAGSNDEQAMADLSDRFSEAVLSFVDKLMELGIDSIPIDTYGFHKDDFFNTVLPRFEKMALLDDDKLDEIWKDAVNSSVAENKSIIRELRKQIDDLRDPGYKRDAILLAAMPEGDRKVLYKRLGGEVEARNVVGRMAMDDAMRRATPMAKTEDMARATQILFQGADDKEDFEPNEQVLKALSNYAQGWISFNNSLSFSKFWSSLPVKVQRQMNRDIAKDIFEGTPAYLSLRDKRRARAEEAAEASFGPKERKGGRSIVDKTDVDQSIKDEVEKKGMRYFAEPMNQSEGQVLMWLDAIGTNEATKAFLTNETELPFHLQAFLGIELLKRLNNESRFNDAAQVAVHLARLGTTLGRGVNAFKALTYLTKEGLQVAVGRIVEKASDGLKKKYRNRINRSIDKYRAAKKYAARVAQGEVLTDKEWLKSAKNDVDRRIQDQLSKGDVRFQSRFTPTGLDPKMVPLMVEYGIYTALEGNKDFKKWSGKMMTRFGLTPNQALEIWDYRPVNGVFTVREIGSNVSFIANVDRFAMSEENVKVVLENYGIYSSADLAKRIYNSYKRNARIEFNKNATRGEKAFVQALDWGDEQAATKLIEDTWIAGSGFQGLDQELQDMIEKTSDVLAKSPTYALKEAAIKDLMTMAFKKVGREPVGEYVSMMMYYNMLSSPGTHLSNILGSLFQSTGDLSSTLFSPILDLPGVRLITGSAEMKVAPQYRFSTREKLRAAAFGFKLGLKNAKDIILTGRLTQVQGQKYEIPNLQERYRFASDVMAHLSKVLPNLKRGKPGTALNDLLKSFFGTYALMAKYNSRAMDAEDAVFRTPTMVSYYVTASEILASREVTEKGDLYQEVLNDLTNRGEITGSPDTRKNTEKIRQVIADRLRGWPIGGLDTVWKRLMDETRSDLVNSGLPFTEQDVVNGASERFPADFRVKDIAERRANRAVFRYPPEGTVGAVAVSLNDFIRKLPFGNNVVPFTNLLANLFNTWLDYLPPISIMRYYGFTLTTASNKMFGKSLPTTNIRGGGGFLRDVDDQILRRNELIWRGTMGLIFMTVAALTLGGEDEEGYPIMTGQGPKDYKKKKELESRGVKWHSIRVPGIGYISYSMLPVGLALSFVGNMFDIERYGSLQEKDRAWAAAIAGFPAYMLDIAFLSSLSDLIQTISNSEKYTTLEKMNEAISRTMSKYVPLSAVLNNLEAALGYEQPELLGWWSLFKSVPFARQVASDKPALDHFGRPIDKRVKDGVLHNVLYHSVGTKRFYTPEVELDPVETVFMEKEYYTPMVSKQTVIGGVKLADDPILYYEFFKLSQRFFKKQADENIEGYRELDKELFDKYMDQMHAKSRDIVSKMLTAGMHPDEISRELGIQP